MNWVETNGKKPRTGERPLLVKFRNGLESRQSYLASQLRWDHREKDPWDIIAVARA